jgi:hypothetical protein
MARMDLAPVGWDGKPMLPKDVFISEIKEKIRVLLAEPASEE